MKEFETGILLRLLQTYEPAIAELQKLHDPAFTDLITRYTKRQAEVLAALADRKHRGANRRHQSFGSQSAFHHAATRRIAEIGLLVAVIGGSVIAPSCSGSSPRIP